MMEPKNWREIVKKARHYIATNNTRIYLYDGSEFPWHLVSDCSEGCSHRLSIPVSFAFEAKHPSGLVFSWSIDIEKPGANGSGSYQIDLASIRDVLEKLPKTGRAKFFAYLLKVAAAAQKQGEGWKEIADGQFECASVLRMLVARG